MKVEKIEIIKTLTEIPDGQQIYRQAIYPGLQTIMKERAEPLAETMTVKEEVFEVRKIANGVPNKINTRNYLVKIDDNKVFNDLMVIGQSDLEKQFNNGEKLGKERVLISFKNFLNRPWYKRLFIKEIIKEVSEELNYVRYNLE